MLYVYMSNKYNVLSSTGGTKTKYSMMYSGNGIGSYNRIYNYNQRNPVQPNVVNLSYYIYASDFLDNSTTIQTTITDLSNNSSYFAGRAPLYVSNTTTPCGTCAATFLSIQTPTVDYPTAPSNIYTDISNYLTVDNGLIISWLTPSNPVNLEIDSILDSMVTECIVKSTTKIGVNPYYGMTFNMIVSNDSGKITFALTSI